jgi:hypothetical protein
VWLFKVLQSTTLALHFTAVHLMVGGLFLATWWAIRGRRGGDGRLTTASGEIAHLLPVVVAYVINLGIPPLLFAQVLYGRALYTSSILIGVFWIMVIFMLIAAYFIMYQMAKRADAGLAFGWLGVIALLLVVKIGFVYTNNMTLMLRPDAWVEMYRSSPTGAHLAPGDPTIIPRWLYMMLGSVGMAGIGLMLLGLKPGIETAAAAFLRSRGGMLLAFFTLVQMVLAAGVYHAQPEAVRAGLWASLFYRGVFGAWFLVALALVALGVFGAVTAARRAWLPATLAGAAGFVNIVLWVLFRDGIRDVTLGLHGYDVWARNVNTNWSIVILFLVLFVAAVGLTGWMAMVTFRAKGADEQHA